MGNSIEGHINRDHNASSGGGPINNDKVEKLNIIENKSIKELKESLNKIEMEMREKGLESDAEIVKKAINRFDRYLKEIPIRQEKYEQKYGFDRSKTMRDNADLYNNLTPEYRISSTFVITFKIGKNGGGVYDDCGERYSWFTDDQTEQVEKERENYENKGLEIINYDFTKDGKVFFKKRFEELYKDNNIQINEDHYNEMGGQLREALALYFRKTFMNSLSQKVS